MREFKTIPPSQLQQALQVRINALEKELFGFLLQLVELDKLSASANEAIAREAVSDRENVILAINQFDERIQALEEFGKQLPPVQNEDNHH